MGRMRWGMWGVALAGLLPLASFLASGNTRNPPVIHARTLEANVRTPPEIEATLHRSCYDCHSNQTRWPWYSRMAPGSWLLAKDVHKARATVNFSEWTTQSGKTPRQAASVLLAACAGIESGRMPRKSYLLLHPEARILPAEAEQFCQWSAAEARQLILSARRK